MKSGSSRFTNNVIIDKSNEELFVYPNPFTSEVIIKSENSQDIIGKTMRLYDVTGKLFVKQLLQSQKTVIPLSQLPSGIYLIKIDGMKAQGIFKLIKQTRYSN